jgi:DNA repair exonuclease SbcCD ATPase subunit
MILLHRLVLTDFKQIASLSLSFPERGTILIEGHNEAGKSSLFEAVYFALYGEALPKVKGDEKIKAVDMKRYGQDQMRVELEFSIHERRFVVERTVRANQKVRLECPHPDGGRETINSTSEANSRIQKELALSNTALLNTCFVEQKKLDQLESLDKDKRRETINELLNIEALNSLEREFKPTPEDRRQVEVAKQRIRVAELDREIPQCEERARAAYRCQRYQEARERDVERQRLARDIAMAERERQQNGNRLAVISFDLERGSAYQQQIGVLRQEIPLRLSAWRTAIREHGQAQKQENQLATLAAGLPQRRAELELFAEWHTSLVALEDLEARSVALQGELQRVQETLTAYDTLHQEWEQGEIQQRALEHDQAACQQARDTATAAWDARNQAIQRDGTLALLGNHIAGQMQALQEADRLASERAETVSIAAQLPALQERLGQIEIAGSLLSARQAIVDRQSGLVEKRKALERRKAEYDALQARITAKEESLRLLAEQVEQKKVEREQAEAVSRAVEQQRALKEWADAEELNTQADPNAARDTGTKERLAAAEEQVTTAKQRLLPGIALLSAGIIAIFVAFITPFVVPVAVLGVLMGVVGALVFGKAQQEAKATNENRIGLAAVVEEQQKKAQESSDQLSKRKADAETKRCALTELGLAVPSTPEVARAEAAQLPDMDINAARQAATTAQTELAQRQGEHNGLLATLQHDRPLLAQQNLEGLTAAFTRQDTDDRAATAELTMVSAQLPSLLASLNLLDDKALTAAIREADTADRNHVASAMAAEQRIVVLEQNESAKRRTAETEAQEAQRIVTELGLEGTTLSEWNSVALKERQALVMARQQTPDETLKRHAEGCDVRLQEVNGGLERLSVLQGQRDRQLKAASRTELAQAVDCTEQSLQENGAQRTGLVWVREELKVAGLPMSAASLHTQLSLRKQTLRSDEEQAVQLPQARQQVNEKAAESERTATEYATGWRNILPDMFVPGVAEADERIAGAVATIQERYDVLHVPALKQEQEQLLGRNERLGQDNATREHQVTTLTNEIADRYRELGLMEADVETVTATDPDLQHAGEHNAAKWQEEHTALTRDINEKRTRRLTIAEPLDLPSTPLEVGTEIVLLREAEQALDVKKRAVSIVQKTRQSIVDRIMPRTLQNVRYLLPALTAGRYKDLDWQSDDNVLLIYDERAGENKRKSVFSGGAKDQISLALRLGFALATLPTGKATRPYWLFLDEPLSSFDRERTLALVDLLTKGVIRKNFQQIFLISHSEAFDPGLFDYRIRMENGALAESNLPQLT